MAGTSAGRETSDPIGLNPGHTFEVSLFDAATGVIRQLTTNSTLGGNRYPQVSNVLWRAPGNFEQITQTVAPDSSAGAALDDDARLAVFPSRADLLGSNGDHTAEMFRRVCFPDPPGASWLVVSSLPGFRFQVRISRGGAVVASRQESDCVGETLCVSGALPGRSELFLRIVGPKPNGYLWPNVVKFSTSQIEVWIEQLSTGKIQYYELPAAAVGSTDLAGFFDKLGFLP